MLYRFNRGSRELLVVVKYELITTQTRINCYLEVEDGDIGFNENNWSAKNIFKNFIVPYEVSQVILAQFFLSEFLVLLHTGGLQLFNLESGQICAVSLPCNISRVWSILNGILLECASGESSTHHHNRLFFLMHPLEEVKPVLLLNPDKMTDMSTVVFTSATSPLAVLYDPQQHLHTFCQLSVIRDPNQRNYETARRSVKEDELESSLSQEMMQDTTFSSQAAQVRLECLYQELQPSSLASASFITHDELDQPLLCLLKKQERKVDCFALKQDLSDDTRRNVTFLWSVPALDAAPVAVTRASLKTFEGDTVHFYDVIVSAMTILLAHSS